MKTSFKPIDNQAFSLIELSVVIVIIGLLVGGVLGGESLIRASELRAINTEYNRYSSAISTFREKFSALPGDMSNASSYWPTANVGNGDGLVKNTAAANTNEVSNFWIHLANAMLIEGSYTAVANTTMTAGINNPKSRLSGAGWNVAHLGTVLDDGTNSAATGATAIGATTFYAGTYGNVLIFGGGTNSLSPNGVLKTEEAWNIDTKMDDGFPITGNITSLESQGSATAAAGCVNVASTTSAIAVTTTYDLRTPTANICSLVFKPGF